MKLHTKVVVACALAASSVSFANNYGEALQKSIYFYEAQQSGELPDWNRVEWRGDSGLTDGSDNNVDLTGGWYDAGDHVKFGFPMAATATMLAWGVIENPDAYEQTGQMKHIKNNLRFVADYFVKAHTAANELWGQVGIGSVDHAWWGSAEVMQMPRDSFKIDAQNPGSDLAAETAAALASIAMVFEQDEPSYAQNLLSHAEQLYSFADTYRGKYSEAIKDAKDFYNSWSGYEDELVWGALWLYQATGNSDYLDQAISGYDNLSTEPQLPIKSYKWAQAWDDKSYGSYVLMAKLTDGEQYQTDAERWLDYWTVGYQGNRIEYTPGGLAHLDSWGSARYTSNTSFIALIYSDYLNQRGIKADKAQTYYDFAESQMDYLLGNNPKNMSYLIGYGDVYPIAPHHRTAHGTWSDNKYLPVENRHTLVGALVGGPAKDDSFENDRGDHVLNEVATDYNAGFTGAIARLWLDYGGNPIAEDQFPAKEIRDAEFFVEAKVNASGSRHIELATLIHNHTAWPARLTDDLTMRYWVDLSEEIAAGYSASDVTVSTAYSQATGVSGLHHWQDNLYYAEVSFSGIKVYPGGQSPSKREVQFRFSLPTNSNAPEWDSSSDPSWDNYSASFTQAPNIALYDGNTLVWGQEPTPACGATTGINCLPVAENAALELESDTSASVELVAADADGSALSYEVIDQPASGTVTLTDNQAYYTPAAGFVGTDSFSFVAIDDAGAQSNTATVSIEVNGPIAHAVTIQSPADGSEHQVGSSLNVQLQIGGVEGVNLYLNGEKVGHRLGDGSLNVTLPTVPGFVELLAIATDDQGQEWVAQDRVELTLIENTIPRAEVACEITNLDQWNSGFVANPVTVTNNGADAISGWQVEVIFAEPVSFVGGWNGTFEVSSDGKTIAVSNEVYNGNLGQGSQTTFGFQGGHEGSLAAPTCIVN